VDRAVVQPHDELPVRSAPPRLDCLPHASVPAGLPIVEEAALPGGRGLLDVVDGYRRIATDSPGHRVLRDRDVEAPVSAEVELYEDGAPGLDPVGGGKVVDRLVEAAEDVEGRAPVGFGVDLRTA
jgi:hypothetical protein